jgi:hypothetical protein
MCQNTLIPTFLSLTYSSCYIISQLSAKYQSIITPAGAAFSIWGVIFIAQAIFVFNQMLKNSRQNPLVQEGVAYWYFVACLFQSAWTFAFGYEFIWLSSIFMFGILASLLTIVYRQTRFSWGDTRIKDFWLFKFPFSIHAGWICAAFAVNVNVSIVAAGRSSDTQISFAYASMVYAVLVAIASLLYLSPPDFTIPCVLAWASMWITVELKAPSNMITATFTNDEIAQIRTAFLVICVLLCLTTVTVAVYRKFSKANKTDDKANYRTM